MAKKWETNETVTADKLSTIEENIENIDNSKLSKSGGTITGKIFGGSSNGNGLEVQSNSKGYYNEGLKIYNSTADPRVSMLYLGNNETTNMFCLFHDENVDKNMVTIVKNGSRYDQSFQNKSGTIALLSDITTNEDASKLSLRPMTPDLHNWIPFEIEGMFVGQGENIVNAPNNLWWRYIGISSGSTEGYVTIIALPLSPGSNRILQKTHANNIWSSWVEYLSSNGGIINGPIKVDYAVDTFLSASKGNAFLSSNRPNGTYNPFTSAKSWGGVFTTSVHENNYRIDYLSNENINGNFNQPTKSWIFNENGQFEAGAIFDNGSKGLQKVYSPNNPMPLKTINNQSLLGTGNINISGDGSGTKLKSLIIAKCMELNSWEEIQVITPQQAQDLGIQKIFSIGANFLLEDSYYCSVMFVNRECDPGCDEWWSEQSIDIGNRIHQFGCSFTGYGLDFWESSGNPYMSLINMQIIYESY